MAGLGARGRIALIVLALLTLGLAATVATRTDGPSQDAESPVGYAGLRPDWVRLEPESPAPPPTATEVLTAAPTELPTSAPTPLPPTPTEEAPPPTETIAIAGVAPPVVTVPSATAALPIESPLLTESPPPTENPPPPTETPLPPAPAVTEGLDLAFAAEIVELTNQARVANGLNPVTENQALVAAAQKYADFHAHVCPDRLDHNLNGSTLGSRIGAEGYTGWTLLAENLCWGSVEPPLSPAEAIEMWLNSPSHRDNLLNPTLNEIGVGCYVSGGPQPFRICVQDFGARP